MARGQRFGSKTKGVFGILAAVITALLGIAIGQRIGGTNPLHFADVVSWSLVSLAVILDFVAVILLVFELRKFQAGAMDGWEDWLSGAFIAFIAVLMFLATLLTWAQHLLERFLRFLSRVTTIAWFDPGNLSENASKVSGLVAFAIVVSLTNWIWHHPLWQGRARDAVPEVKRLTRREKRTNQRAEGGSHLMHDS